MNLPHRLKVALVAATCGLLAATTGCGTQPATRKNTAEPVRSTASDSADALIVKALTAGFVNSNVPKSVAYAKRAAHQAPDRREIVWLYAQLCLQTGACPPEPEENKLRNLDPENGTAWLGALARAQKEMDTTAEDTILEAMSRSSYFNIYWNTLASGIAVELNRQSPPPQTDDKDGLTESLNRAVSWLSTIATVQFQPLIDTCNAGRIQRSATAKHCAKIAAALQRSDSYIAEGMGLGIAERLVAVGAEDRAKVADRISLARYHRETAGEIIQSQQEQNKFTREMLKLMASLPREQDVFTTVIRWAHLPLQPPQAGDGVMK